MVANVRNIFREDIQKANFMAHFDAKSLSFCRFTSGRVSPAHSTLLIFAILSIIVN